MGLYIGYAVLLIALGVIIKILTPKVKGWFGESVVAQILSGLPVNEYKVLNNIMLKNTHGTTQIDHIVVSVYGIFVIETKNYKGWITGSEFSEQWTKNMYGKKFNFRNPLKQNYGHVKALEELLGLPKDKFIPIVAFSWNTEIKVKTSKPVIYVSQLRGIIQSYQQELFQVNELQEIVNKITGANIDSKDTRKEHVAEIHNKIRDDNIKISNSICPRCGGALVKRNGKYGAFIGCSNYPKCRYTQK